MTLPSVELLTTKTLQVGSSCVTRATMRQPLSRLGIDRDQGDVGLRLHHDVGEEFIPGALRFEPDDVNSQKQMLQSGTRGVVGIDDGKSANAFHQTDAFAEPFGVFSVLVLDGPICSGRLIHSP